jgi:hypothetical protein
MATFGFLVLAFFLAMGISATGVDGELLSVDGVPVVVGARVLAEAGLSFSPMISVFEPTGFNWYFLLLVGISSKDSGRAGVGSGVGSSITSMGCVSRFSIGTGSPAWLYKVIH